MKKGGYNLKSILLKKIKEATISVFPVSAIVVLLNLTPLVDLSTYELGVFLLSSFFLILGIGMFNLGADLAMTPMGEQIGAGLIKSRSVKTLLAVCFLMGLFITIAEPDLSVLATQVSKVIDPITLILFVGVGVGFFLLLSALKIIFKKPLSSMLIFFYMMLFCTAALVILQGNESFLALAFDSGGVTTGPITVPFIMSLGVGIAATVGGKNVGENCFGLIAMCSVGPILAVILLGIGVDGDIGYKMSDYGIASDMGSVLFDTLVHTFKEVSIALLLIVAFFTVLQIFCLKLPKKTILRIVVGIAYTLFGLVI